MNTLARIFFLSFLTLIPLVAQAAQEMIPTNISADAMDYDLDGKTLVFNGAVSVEREDIRIESDTLSVRFSKSTNTSPDSPLGGDFDPGAIERIEAKGSVRIKYQGREGSCGLASYDVTAGVLTLEDNPELRDGDNRIQGEIIRFNLKENRSEVIGGAKRRVQATFNTPKGMESPLKP